MRQSASIRPDVETPSSAIITEERSHVLPPAQRFEREFPRPERGGITRHPWVRSVFATAFRAMQRAGLNLTPNHFYWPIPDFRELDSRNWQALSRMVGLELHLDDQLERLRSLIACYRDEMHFPEAPCEDPTEFHVNNGFFETVDAEVAYSMVRHYKPRRMIEVGGGNSTRLSASAMLRNAEEGFPGKLFTIEPHPDPVLRAGIPGLTRLIQRPVQQIPLEFFDRLSDGDILFLDSSHVVAVGSDVLYEYLEILPRLRPGVIVHVHDVFLPADYPRKFVMHNLCFWAEQYVLQAFLTFNPCFEVLWSSSAVHIARRSELQQAIPHWRDSYLRMPREIQTFTPTYDGYNVWPCSFWMRRTDQNPQTVRS
jgi:Methyltransferase domain